MNIKDTAYWSIFADTWDYFKEFMDVQEADEYWQAVIDKSSELYKKYESKPEGEFAKHLIFSVMDELEQIERRRKRAEAG